MMLIKLKLVLNERGENMAIDLDYMVRLKDGRVIEREMVRGELRNVICKVTDEMNPTWSDNDFVLTERKDLIKFSELYTKYCPDSAFNFVCGWTDKFGDDLRKSFNKYNFNDFVNMAMDETNKVWYIEDKVGNSFPAVFLQSHMEWWDLGGAYYDEEVTKEELRIFIAYYERMMTGGKLCFGYHIDKIEELQFSVY